MSDPNRDWLDEELKNLQELEAPTTLLPGVMKKIQQRAANRWWVRMAKSHSSLLRTFGLGISLFMLGLLLVVNPAEYFSHVPGASTLLNLIPLLLEAAKTVFFQAKIFDFSVWGLLASAIVFSYILLIATASAIQQLASTRK